MTTAALAWKTVPRYPDATHRPTDLPVGTQERAASVERYLRKLAGHAPLSSPRVYALMCIADQAAVAAGGPTLSGLEWGYSGWAPVPVGAESESTPHPARIREHLRVRRTLRAVWLEHAGLCIEDLAAGACRAFDELRLAKHKHI
jgi:hypothetical protein